MPIKGEKYHIVPFENGWRVMADNGTFYSVKPLTKTRARAQQRALYAKQRSGEIFHGGSYSLITHNGKCDCVMKGSGWLGDVFAKVKKTVSNAIGTITNRVAAVSKGIRNNYPPSARNTIARFSSGIVTNLRIRREPIRSMLNSAINIITLGAWNPARRDLAFDKLYHLSLVATVRMPDGDHNIMIEKNEVIGVNEDFKTTSGMNFFDIEVPCCVSLLQFLQNAEAKGGADYFKYDAFTNNCQMFINLLLDANNLNSPEASKFVMQDVEQLLKRIPSYTSGVARFATNLGALADVAMHGEGKKIVMEPSDFFKEHNDLVKLLDTIATTLHKEARGQATEAKGWRRKLEGRSTKMVGGVRLNGMMVLDAAQGISDLVMKPEGFDASKVRQGWVDKPADMPSVYNLSQMARACYSPNKEITGYTILEQNPYMIFYQKNGTDLIIVAIRGTEFSDMKDVAADVSIVSNGLSNSSRYKQDLATLQAVQQKYLPEQYTYYGVGHSLSGAILDKFLNAGLFKSGVSFNPAVERQDFARQNGNHRIYLSCDPLYKIMGKFVTNGNLEVIPMPADWDNLEAEGAVIKTNSFGKKYNCRAGFNRNKTMAIAGDVLLCIWDMESPGSQNMMAHMRELGKPVYKYIPGRFK